MTKDKEHIIVAGTYPPRVKCFTTSDMSLKFQRGLTADVIAMTSLSDDFGKLVFLQSDRTLNFHAPYGTHYSVRIPKFGRDLAYYWDTCDLFVTSSGDEVYRLNLEDGQFKEPFKLGFEGCNKVDISHLNQIVALGGDLGHLELWDARGNNKKALSSIIIPNEEDVTALKFEQDGLMLGVGTSAGNCLFYDIRSSRPVFTKEHQYGLPIIDITYHNSSRMILTTERRYARFGSGTNPTEGKF